MRCALDAFQPDLVLIWGDDEYKNFREDVILAFTVCAYEDLDLHPWRLVQGSSMMAGKPNAWREGPDKRDCMRGRRAVARYLMTSLIDQGFDVANAYKPLHHESLAHAFTNAILYLDYDRTGRDYPTTSVPIIC